MHFSFSLAEVLGVVDPRVICSKYDSELLALWKAYFTIKNETLGNPPRNPSKPKTPTVIDLPDMDKQVATCERLLM